MNFFVYLVGTMITMFLFVLSVISVKKKKSNYSFWVIQIVLSNPLCKINYDIHKTIVPLTK